LKDYKTGVLLAYTMTDGGTTRYDKGMDRKWTIMAGVPGEIGGLFHIPNILRKDDPEKTEGLILTDAANQDN
jgi:hypothetical protein